MLVSNLVKFSLLVELDTTRNSLSNSNRVLFKVLATNKQNAYSVLNLHLGKKYPFFIIQDIQDVVAVVESDLADSSILKESVI